MDIISFLGTRGIEEEVIDKLKNEKIDAEVVNLMSDEDLQKFIPKYGDRVALRQFCLHKTKRSDKKMSLLEKLKKKIKKKSRQRSESSSDEEISNKKLKHGNCKTTRQIELGWLCSIDGNRFHQVKTRTGGGIRKVSVPKNAKKDDLIKKAIELFFPNNVSSKGNIEKFSYNLWDFKSSIINDDLTVEEMFKISGLARLRFYLATKEKCETATSGTNVNISDPLSVHIPDDTLNDLLIFHNDEIGATSYSELASVQPDSNTDEPFDGELNVLLSETSDVINNNNSSRYVISPDPVFVTNDNNVKNTIYIHRGHIFEELIEAFLNIDKLDVPLAFKMILPNGEEENGMDFGGVFRDALSEFWKDFYERCTLGTLAKVPAIRHDYNGPKWTAIAKILYKGWKEVEYFPIELSRSFLEMCIFESTKSDIIESFLNYVSSEDKATLKMAIANFEEVDIEDLLDVLGNLDCKVKPDKTNIKKTIMDIAHKELVQKPMFIIDNWRLVLKNLASEVDLKRIYEKQHVNAKNVIALLYHENELSADQNNVLDLLKKYLRDCDLEILKKFLRFCTGADMITSKKILVKFNCSNGFQRTIKAHTCACSIELPETYNNLLDLRSELNSVLKSNIWIMDYV